MDFLNDFVSLNFDNLNIESKEEIYEALLNLNINDVLKKHLRKFLQLALNTVKFKGEQVIYLQKEIEKSSQTEEESGNETSGEVGRLKELINKLESEKIILKVKLKEMGEQVMNLQARIHESSANESDKDSNDPLSELDKHEELFKKISMKNKHIKRLIKDIELLQIENIEQSKAIIELERRSQLIITEKLELESQVVLCENEKKQLNERINELTLEITRLESNVTYLEEEREKSDFELKEFIEQLEERAKTWKKIINEKEMQLDSLKVKYDLLRTDHPKKIISAEQEHEVEKLVEAVQERDNIIEELEVKIKTMAEEMITSTKLMNQISAEREAEKSIDFKQKRNCCKTIQDSLNLLQERYKELSEMMEKVEEDNEYKSKQTSAVLKSLNDIRNGDDIVSVSLQKIANLERKLGSRDKQIQALVMEINSLHELSQENTILRKKLNIPEDEIVLTNNLVAKQRNKDKIMDRLTLKFRASEEMRLQLKLEKTELKKRIIELEKKLTNQNDIKSLKEESENVCNEIFCDNCLKSIQTIPNRDEVFKTVIKEWEDKYADVIEENENLRVGMHEILEKIRDYDATSDHITIDCSILEKVLHALDARSISGWYHPAMRMQNELIAVREREHALKEKIQLVEKSTKVLENIHSVKSSNKDIDIKNETSPSKTTQINKPEGVELVGKEVGEVEIVVEENINKNEIETPKDLITQIIERSVEHETYKNNLSKLIEKNRNLQVQNDALKMYEVQFNEVIDEMKKSETHIINYCSSLVERLTDLELKYRNHNKKYEFLKEDFDKCISDYKFTENINICLIADLKKQINNKKHEINLNKLIEKRRKSSYVSKDEILTLRKKYLKIENQMADFISNLFKNRNYEDLIKNTGVNYGIIKENLELDFLTIEEYENIKNINKNLQDDNDNLIIKCEQLEDSLAVAQDQIKSQQKLFSEITDNHIELRHLVADLQSSSEDKFLITKAQRDLEIYKKECIKLRNDKEILDKQNQDEKQKFENLLEKINSEKDKIDKQNANNDLKIKFLKKYIFTLQEKYCKYTPLIYLTDFTSLYIKLLNLKNKNDKEPNYLLTIDDIIANKLKTFENAIDSIDVVKLVQYEVKCNFLEEQLKLSKQKLEIAEKELNTIQIATIEGNEQWRTIQILFGDIRKIKETSDVEAQTISKDFIDIAVNTDKIEEVVIEKVVEKITNFPTPSKVDFESQVPTPTIRRSLERQDTVIIQSSMRNNIHNENEKMSEELKSIENQLHQAKSLASIRNTLLLDLEKQFAEANGRIEEMEKIIEEQKKTIRLENFNSEKKTSGIIETTITSLQSLLSEKDTTLNHYQDLLKTEREQHFKSCETFEKELNSLKKILAENEIKIQNKNQEIMDLKTKIENFNKNNSLKNEVTEKILSNDDLNEDCDMYNINEISDEKIEEMFLDESKNLTSATAAHRFLSMPNSGNNQIKQIQQLQLQAYESKNRELLWENTIRSKEEEIYLLKEKLTILEDREKLDVGGNVEIDQLKILLEEKDKHIHDLMETLTSFHDDQQRFLSETSLYSADQMTQLGTNLNRCEATNKILQTQLDALKRQLTTLSQREKQSRDLANSLRNQLIKRPVVSIKSELNARSKNEQQQKRIQQLETELEIAKKEIQQQQQVIETKRAKNANEINMWEKQKRLQQNAEKLKIKLEETEKSLDKTRSLLNAARTTITRLEKDKNLLQTTSLKSIRASSTSNNIASTIQQCCQNRSCPNFQIVKIGHNFDNIDAMTSCQSECSTERIHDNNYSIELIDQLKSKIEMQQRRIRAFEASKGSSTMVYELEKLQEKISALEAQNIRWEAKNLQLQLDLDLLRQGDDNERNKNRIKHLEDYILALKEELAQVEVQKEYRMQPNNDRKTQSEAEQTILALKRIIDRLKIENKSMKEGPTTHYMCRNDKTPAMSEITRLKHLYGEAMNKITALQIELQVKTNCESSNNATNVDCDFIRELKYVKEQLIKKTQLLEKAKILLTRAAAKEKSLKDQLSIWKRKCSELQNVPVIEEISE